MSVFSFHIFVVFLLSASKKRDIRILILPNSYMWQKFSKMNENRSVRYQSRGAEYVTGQINSPNLQLLLRQFYCFILALSQKS